MDREANVPSKKSNAREAVLLSNLSVSAVINNLGK
jgi:hypothetical protein